MKKWALILLGVLLLTGCRRDPVPQAEYSLNLSIYVKGATVSTKASTDTEEGQVNASDAERAIRGLQIWVFEAGTSTLIAYFEPKTSDYNFQNDQVIKLQASIKEAIARAQPHVDIFALANGTSVVADLSSSTTRTTLESLQLTGGVFGTETLCEAVPDGGLPLAGVLLNAPMVGAFPVMRIESVVDLTRLVSKIRFVFCQLAGEDGGPLGDVQFTGISLSGSVAAAEQVFSVSRSGTAALSKTWTGDALPQSIAVNRAPVDYLYNQSGSAREYDTRLDNGVTQGVLTEWKRIYLREGTDALSGTIQYKTSGTGAVKQANFSLPAGLFTRNHYWVIYAYFLGGKLYVEPAILPWTAEVLDYDTQGATRMEWESYVRYDLDKEANTWDDTYVAVAYRPASDYESGRQPYSPVITLRTANAYPLRVQVNSPTFKILQVTLGIDGEPVAYQEAAPDPTSLPIETGEQITTFCLVPVDNADLGDASVVRVFLTEIQANADGTPLPVNIPFNHDLPGDEDHTSIIYNKVPHSDYQDVMEDPGKYMKDSGSTQRNNFWIERKGT